MNLSIFAQIRFYLDESVDPAIAEQLRLRGVEAYTTRELGKLGASDAEQLQTALALNAVLVTHDVDFLRMQATQTLFIKEQQFSTGFIVRVLEQVALHCTLEDFVYVRFLQEFTYLLQEG